MSGIRSWAAVLSRGPYIWSHPLRMQPELKEEGEFKYIEVGDGPPLIFLHGLFGALSNFEGPIDYFGRKYRVVMPMLPLQLPSALCVCVIAIGSCPEPPFVRFGSSPGSGYGLRCALSGVP